MTIREWFVTNFKDFDPTQVRLLNTNVSLSQLRDRDELDPSHQLALTILAEARGGTEAEVHQTILPAWRPHLEVVSDLRKVEEVGG